MRTMVRQQKFVYMRERRRKEEADRKEAEKEKKACRTELSLMIKWRYTVAHWLYTYLYCIKLQRCGWEITINVGVYFANISLISSLL